MAPKNKLIPATEYCNGFIINKNGDISIVYELDKPPGFTRTAAECIQSHLGIVKALSSLGPRVIVQFQDRYTRRDYSPPDRERPPDELEKANDRLLARRRCLDHHAYMVITATGGSQGAPLKIISTLTKKNLIPRSTRDESQLTEIKD